MPDLEKLPPDDFSQGDIFSQYHSAAEEEIEQFLKVQIKSATDRLRIELNRERELQKHKEELRKQEIESANNKRVAERAELHHKTELQKKEIEKLENELQGEKLNQAARQETRRYTLAIYGVVVLFTMVMYALQGFGKIQLSDGLIWGLVSLTIGEAAGLAIIVYRSVFHLDKSDQEGKIAPTSQATD